MRPEFVAGTKREEQNNGAAHRSGSGMLAGPRLKQARQVAEDG
jgi:hypothetical protein